MELQLQTLNLKKDVLGSKHPDTLTTMINIASTYSKQGHSDMAEPLEVQVLDGRRAIFGEQHTVTIKAMSNLAVTYQYLDRLGDSKALMERATALSK